MTHELRINNECVDIGDVNIALVYKSNLLSDIDKITSSHSYTITLPMTTRNERIFNYSRTSGTRNGLVAQYLPASYIRNGIEITRNATAYVESITEKGFNVVLIWDNVSALTEWIKGGKSIKDLTYNNIVWSSDYANRNWFTYDAFIGRLDTGVDASIIPPLPSVNVANILTKIFAEMGITYDVRSLHFPLFNRPSNVPSVYAIPITTRGGGAENATNGTQFTDIVPIRRYEGADYGVSNGHLVGRVGVGYVSDIGLIKIELNNLQNVRVLVDLKWIARNYHRQPTLNVSFYLGSSTTAEIQVLSQGATIDASGNMTLSCELDTDCQNYDALFIAFHLDADEYCEFLDGSTGSIQIIPTRKTAIVGDEFDVQANVPDIKQVDFVKAILNLLGCAIVMNEDGTFTITDLDYVTTRDAIDWSSKIVNYNGMPKDVSFKSQNFARKNFLKYSADKNTNINHDGMFTVDNDILEEEKTLFTFPFSATENGRIPYFKLSDNGEVSDEDVTTRIVRFSGLSQPTILVDDEKLNLQSVLTEYYNAKINLARSSVKIKVFAKLTELDLRSLDWTRPVYLEQTGQKYIVDEIDTDASTEISEVTLIQI